MMRQAQVVALGGGHGLAASLQALRLVTDEITAIVTVADDGGSSGRLRREFDVLPPGDLRMALAALCEETEQGHRWAKVLQHRLGGRGPLAGHALGNLLIMSLWEIAGDPVDGLDHVGRMLEIRGRVLPMCETPLVIEADVEGLDSEDPTGITKIQGQVEVATTTGMVRHTRLLPEAPDACPEALIAVRDADWVILGPGSWYTSVLPHLLVPQLCEAIAHTQAKKLLTLNLMLKVGETAGLTPAQCLRTLADHAPGLRLDVVLADPSEGSADDEELQEAVRALGAELVCLPVARMDHPGQHDTLRLAAAYRDILG